MSVVYRSTKAPVYFALLVFALGCRKVQTVAVKPIVVKSSVPATLKQKSSPVASLPDATMHYSNMRIVEEEGDFLGWDIQVTPEADGYRVVAFDGEGVPEGPFRGHIPSLEGEQTIPGNPIFPDRIHIKFVHDGVLISVGEGESEFVPQHENFIKLEKFK